MIIIVDHKSSKCSCESLLTKNYILETTETQPNVFKVGTSTFGSIHGIDHYYDNYPHPNFIIIILSSPPLYLLAGAKWPHPWHWGSSAHCLAQSAGVATWLNNISITTKAREGHGIIFSSSVNIIICGCEHLAPILSHHTPKRHHSMHNSSLPSFMFKPVWLILNDSYEIAV